jgi:hypothetical protein
MSLTAKLVRPRTAAGGRICCSWFITSDATQFDLMHAAVASLLLVSLRY